MLQYRSVAFVTYENELSAQFAKEAMACQSLDNDEILNVRWATEDPNPTSKVEEQARLEEVGKKAVKSPLRFWSMGSIENTEPVPHDGANF